MEPAATLPVAALLEQLEAHVRRDPARRGLLADRAGFTGPGRGQLDPAARSLAEQGRSVVIVTGFAVPMADGPCAETDGPLGSVILADVLRSLGLKVRLVTDDLSAGAVRAAAAGAGLPIECVAACPLDPIAARDWCRALLAAEPGLTHLIAVERVGPSHTRDSVARQARAAPFAEDSFQRHVSAESWDRSHNMRGESIDAHTAPLHCLFEEAAETRPGVKTIGIGDGGNEIGMGSFVWEDLHPLVADGYGPRIVCRIPTDWTIVSGTSNWGASALAAGTALLRERLDLLTAWTAERQEQLLWHIVRAGPAVDGVTRTAQATVDGLSFNDYIEPWMAIQKSLAARG